METLFPTLLAQSSPFGGGGWTFVLYMGGLFAIMYFILIRPQSKQAKQHRELLTSLKKGDDVITQAGLIGKIYAVQDKVILLEIANGVRVRVLKSSVQGKAALTDEAAPAKAEEKKEEK
ncbi:MAG: preprotein translocase subunit YajC [Myxococcaceae bacterium]|nr:preprotein translocase subunit YajC [Myxococcaceae bacterium]